MPGKLTIQYFKEEKRRLEKEAIEAALLKEIEEAIIDLVAIEVRRMMYQRYVRPSRWQRFRRSVGL